jgi:hypothetical protein
MRRTKILNKKQKKDIKGAIFDVIILVGENGDKTKRRWKMKVYLNGKEGKPRFILKYETGEWEQIEEKLKQMGLMKTKITNLWGLGIETVAYRETNQEMLNYVKETLNASDEWKDDLNYPFISQYGTLNIAIFRVIPIDGKVEAPLPKFITIQEFNRIIGDIKKCLEVLLNLVIEGKVEVKL